MRGSGGGARGAARRGRRHAAASPASTCPAIHPSLARRRPSAHELLSDPFIKRGAKAAKLAELLLHEVPEVGSAEASKLDGADAKPAGMAALSARGATLVPGTTWIFPDDLRGDAKAAAGAGAGGDADAGLGEAVMSNEALDELLEQGLEALGE